MAMRKVDAALLTDPSALLSGIITNKDVATRVIDESLKPRDTLVSKVMTRNPIFVMAESSAVEALEKMIQGNFRHLPVVKNGEVISLLDITKCLYDAIAKMEKVAKKGSAIVAAIEGIERQFGDAPSSFIETLREQIFRPTLSIVIAENTKVATVSPSESVYMAAKKMREFRVNSVIVTTGMDGQVHDYECSRLLALLLRFVDKLVDFFVGGKFLSSNSTPTDKRDSNWAQRVTRFPSAEWLVAIGDIRGDLQKARQALMAAQVMDEKI